jgi:hypothetical protein
VSIARERALRERAVKVRDLYLRLGTLRAAAEQLGITRERVRQIIASGVRQGFFEKPARASGSFDAERAYSALLAGEAWSKVAADNGVTKSKLRYLLNRGLAGAVDAAAVRRAIQRASALDEYSRVCGELGGHPTTTEMQRSKKGHALHAKILRAWGSIEAFRLEVGAPTPTQGNPHIRTDTRRGQDKNLARFRSRRVAIRKELLGLLAREDLTYTELAQRLHGVCGKILLSRMLNGFVVAGILERYQLGIRKFYKVRGNNDEAPSED